VPFHAVIIRSRAHSVNSNQVSVKCHNSSFVQSVRRQPILDVRLELSVHRGDPHAPLIVIRNG
jgi:hypothetical protein